MVQLFLDSLSRNISMVASLYIREEICNLNLQHDQGTGHRPSALHKAARAPQEERTGTGTDLNCHRIWKRKNKIFFICQRFLSFAVISQRWLLFPRQILSSKPHCSHSGESHKTPGVGDVRWGWKTKSLRLSRLQDADRFQRGELSCAQSSEPQSCKLQPPFAQSISALTYKEAVGLHGAQNQNIMSFKAPTTNSELCSTCIS